MPAGHTVGQPAWAPSGKALVFTAWQHSSSHFGTQRRLGSVFCFNRLCGLHVLDVLAASGGYAADAPLPESQPVATGLRSALSPRFTPDGTQLVFLSHEAALECGAHNATASLHALPWAGSRPASGGSARCVLPVVQRPTSAGAFPGLFPAAPLLRAPWLPDGRCVLASCWGAGDAIIAIDLASGAVERLSSAAPGHWALLDVAAGCVAAAHSTPSTPAQLAVLYASAPGSPTWVPVEAPEEPFAPDATTALAGLEHQLLPVAAPGSSPGDVECILLRPAQAQGAPPPPVVLVPHGGPHSACVAAFLPSLAFLASQGFAVLQARCYPLKA